MKAYQKLQRYWAAGDPAVPSARVDERDIASLESRYAVTLPDDFREYLLRSSPIDDDATDDVITTWWPLTRIRSIPEEYEHDIRNAPVAANAGRYLFFADHVWWCWAWAINCGEDEHRGRVVVINGTGNGFVADSFSEFVDRYVRDHRAVS